MTSAVVVKIWEWVCDVRVVTGSQLLTAKRYLDVEHEEEAYLSCSSSDYGEHKYLSPNKEDLADTDSEGSVQHPGIEPYQYEPYLSSAGEDWYSEDDGTSSDRNDKPSERLGNDK